MKRKIIGGLVADTDLYLNKDNNEKVLIDTDSGFLADNNDLYKGINLGYDPYKDKNINNKGKSYLRIFYNNKVDLKKLRSNIYLYNSKYEINQAIDQVREKTKYIMIFGLITYISFLLIIIFLATCKDDDKAAKASSLFIILFIVFYIVSLVYVGININKFNKLEDIYEKADNLPRIINIIIFILYLVLLVYIIFFFIYLRFLRKKCKADSCNICNKKSEVNNTTMADEKISEKS